jgi:hypothetical protein
MGKGIWVVICVCGAAMLGGGVAYTLRERPVDERARIELPGTGVAMVLPDGVKVAPLGTSFTNDAHDIFVSIIMGPSSTNPAGNQTMKRLYPDPVEPFRTAGLSGDLYRRTRAQDGGQWDGWWLNVSRSGHTLDVRILYTGSKPGEFQALKAYLSTVTWNDQHSIDPELAFGVSMQVQGLQLVRTVLGGLMYNADGKAEQRDLYLFALASVPLVSLKGQSSKFQPLCEKDASVIAHGGPVPQVRYATGTGMTVCDAWTSTTLTGSDYTAVLVFSDGYIVQVVGHGDPDTFQRALLGARELPRDFSGRG